MWANFVGNNRANIQRHFNRPKQQQQQLTKNNNTQPNDNFYDSEFIVNDILIGIINNLIDKNEKRSWFIEQTGSYREQGSSKSLIAYLQIFIRKMFHSIEVLRSNSYDRLV